LLTSVSWIARCKICDLKPNSTIFLKGKIYVRGKLIARGERKRADYILYYKANPIAIIEAKDNNHCIRARIQRALNYATTLDIPCVFSNNGDGFLFHDRTATDLEIEQELSLDEFFSVFVIIGKI
jgi:type I restriction enzyme R subunit